MSKVIFFTAGNFPTPQEQADINALNAGNVEIVVRSKLPNASYGEGRIEPSDFVYANANIPTAYAGVPTITNPHVPADALLLTEGAHEVTGVTPTGTFVSKVTLTVTDGAITAIVLS